MRRCLSARLLARIGNIEHKAAGRNLARFTVH